MCHPPYLIPGPSPTEPAPKPDLDGLLRTMVQSLKQEARRPLLRDDGEFDPSNCGTFDATFDEGVREGETLQARWVLDTLGIAYDG